MAISVQDWLHGSGIKLFFTVRIFFFFGSGLKLFFADLILFFYAKRPPQNSQFFSHKTDERAKAKNKDLNLSNKCAGVSLNRMCL